MYLRSRLQHRFHWAILATLFALWALATVELQTADAEAARGVSFSRDVLPILSAKCFRCHGPDEQTREADLRLDTESGALRSENPVIRPGRSGESELVRRITSGDPDERMPPAEANRQLTPSEIDTLTRWVDDGAEWGSHWAFETPLRPLVPAPAGDRWSRNAIDRFVLARLNEGGLSPSPEAPPGVLLRRVTLDLTGLPPTPEEIDAFLADDRPDAYERVVERLLASPHYGERWGRHWLDAARYADSTGFETDAPRSNWRYRDWVIAALNDGMPFDRFTIEQLAGDLLPGATRDDRIATGFLLCGPQDGGSEPSRLDAVVERVSTIGNVYMGLSVGCAQCHSHKFDPLSQQEYYGLFAFFNAADESVLELAPNEEVSRRNALQAQVAALTTERDEYAKTLGDGNPQQDAGYQARTQTIEELKTQIPELPHAPVLHQPVNPRTTTMFVRGEYTQPGDVVAPDVPNCLPPMPAGPPTRLEFAKWLVSAEHPLTARVTVNRVWQRFFGRGLVETENDFGVQGARPTHPELLDWLSREFIDNGWQLKLLQRLIVCSATYRQASWRRDDLDAVDPENRLLARQSRLRLEAESIRDAALGASGLLSSKIGGPGVFPFQHDGVMLNRATPA